MHLLYLSHREHQPRRLNQISHIHRHLLNSSIVKSLDVPKDPLVLLGNKVNRNSFSAETATTSNSIRQEHNKALQSHVFLF